MMIVKLTGDRFFILFLFWIIEEKIISERKIQKKYLSPNINSYIHRIFRLCVCIKIVVPKAKN